LLNYIFYPASHSDQSIQQYYTLSQRNGHQKVIFQQYHSYMILIIYVI